MRYMVDGLPAAPEEIASTLSGAMFTGAEWSRNGKGHDIFHLTFSAADNYEMTISREAVELNTKEK